MATLRFTVTAFEAYNNSNNELQAAFMSASLANQWAKDAAKLEGKGWLFRVHDTQSGDCIAVYTDSDTIGTPNGIGFTKF